MTIGRTSVIEDVGSSGESDADGKLRRMAARFYSEPVEAAELARQTWVIIGSGTADDPNISRNAVAVMRDLVLARIGAQTP